MSGFENRSVAIGDWVASCASDGAGWGQFTTMALRTILTVDDSLSVRLALSHTLRLAGYEVVASKDGEAGFSKAQAHRFDLVITDLYMPGMDGLALTRSLRGLPQYRDVPILVLTTESGEGFKQQGKEAGVTGWLVKPFDPDKLVHVVCNVIPRLT